MWVSCYWIFSFLYSVMLTILFVSFLLLSFALSVVGVLRITASNYTFGIFNLSSKFMRQNSSICSYEDMHILFIFSVGRHGQDLMVIGFTTTYVIGAYHHWCCVFEFDQGRCTTLCDNVCQWFATGRWFSPDAPVSFTSKTDILLKVALNTIKLTNKQTFIALFFKINICCIF